MTPRKIPYRAPENACRFFERFRAAIAAALPADLRALHRPNEAETRSGGSTAYKRHLHHSRFNDLKSGFYYVLWPNDLGLGGRTAALGLYVSFEPFKKGVHRVLGPRLRTAELGAKISELEFDASPNLPLNARDRTTGTWLVKRVVNLDFADLAMADDAGKLLGGLMSTCLPVVQELVEQDFPAFLKGRARPKSMHQPATPPEQRLSLRQRRAADSPPPPARSAPPQAIRQVSRPEDASPITFDESTTRSRIETLDAYMRREIMRDGRFACASETPCRSSISGGCSFHPGQMSHVGSRYDAAIGGMPIRVVVVGMSYGTDHELVSLDARREMVVGVAKPGRKLNPHMKGTVLALRAAFGLPTGDLDIENEYLDEPNSDHHVFNAFALVNCLLCSARKEGKKDHGTRGMRLNCRRHLVETLRILNPNLVLLQGGPPAEVLSDWVTPEGDNIGELALDGVRAVTCTFTHPAAWRDDAWGSPKSEYLRSIVIPNIEAARSRLGLPDAD